MTSSQSYNLRAAGGGFFNPYGRIVQGNMDNSFGPFIDPEMGRQPHLRPQMMNLKKRHKRQYDSLY